MKLNELKCDLCEKNKKFLNNNNSNNSNNTLNKDDSESHLNNSTSTTGEHSITESSSTSSTTSSSQKQVIIAKCLECNYFLCCTCFNDHQIITAFSNHQIVNLNNISLKEDHDLNDEGLTKSCQLNSNLNAQKQQISQNPNQMQISNLAQLQQQFNNLEDQLRVKNKQQQQQQQSIMISSQQQQQQQRLLQIETEIQKSYNFYMQMLKERKDYLINELNTIVQYAVLNHSQNYNKQLKLKAELEQKRVNLELSDSMQTFLSNDPSKVSPLNDLNNNKVNSNLAELNNLSMINNQIIAQLKANNPLSQIEFVSNYSAIQTSIRNTFGYIRINNQMNSQNVNQPKLGQQQDMNYNDNTRNLNNPTTVYDYLNQMSKNQNQRTKTQNELHIDLEATNQQQFKTGFQNEGEIPYDCFGNPRTGSQFSGSSSSSSNSNSSAVTNSSSGYNQNNTIQQQKYQQKPIGTSHSSYDTSSTSPISISTDNLQMNSGLPSNSSNASSSNYFLETFNKDWPNSNGINDLIQKPKPTENESNEINQLAGEDFFNSTMMKSKSSWSSIVSSADQNEQTQEILPQTKDNLFSHSYFDSSSFDPASSKPEHNQSPTLSALLNKNNSLNKYNNNSITLSGGSAKSVGSSSNHSNSYIFQGKTNEDHMLLANNLSGQKLGMSGVSSQSASPEDRLSTLSSSVESSACSESNYHDSTLATLKSVMKSTSTNGNLGQLSGRSTTIDHSGQSSNANLAVGSSTRSQLRRSKMIYHCKFGEFGINDGQFTEPSGVTINTNNDIIVADTNSHRIQIFDKDGRFKFKFGECGKRDGQLLYPNRVSVVKHTGDIVVTERSPTHQIQIYNKYGQFLRKFGANILQHPRGVCVDSKGRIIVVECKVMRVLIFDLMGNVLQKFNCSKYLEFPNGVCCSSGLDREEIYISDNRAHCIKVFDYNGNFIRQIGGEGITNYPIGVGINSNNEILVADNHNNFNLTVFSQDGQLINALESKVKHAQCFDVGLMDDGSIVLASKDYRIYVYKYVNNNLSLSSSYANDTNQMVGNNNENCAPAPEFNFEHRDIIQNEEPALQYDLFSPQIADLTNYNQLMNLAASNNNQFNGLGLSSQSFAKSKSSENLLDNLNTFNCLIAN